MKSINVMFSASAWDPDEKDAWILSAHRKLVEAGFNPVKFTDLHLDEDKSVFQVIVDDANTLVAGENAETTLAAFGATMIVMSALHEMEGFRDYDWTNKFKEP